MKLCTMTPVYNEFEVLERKLKNEYEFGIKTAIYVDGKWKNFNDPNAKHDGLSYDGTRELIKSYPNTILVDLGNSSEEAMLNCGFQTAAKIGMDCVLQMGADEFLTGDLYEFHDNIPKAISKHPEYHFFNVKFEGRHITPAHQVFSSLGRLITEPMWIRIRTIHWWYYYLNRRERQCGFEVKGLTIVHDDRIRKPHRENQMDEYQQRNVEREKKIIEDYRQRGIEHDHS